MLHFSKWKQLGILLAVLISVIMALPNVLPARYQDMLRPYGLRPITLGLDLQGGVNILLEIDREDLKKRLTEQLVGDIRSTLREAKIGYNGINRGPDGVRVRITRPEDMDRAVTGLRKLAQPVEAGGLFGAGAATALFDVGIDGQQVNFTFNEQGIDNKIQQAVSQSIKIVEKRVNPDGVVEATIQQQGKDRIVVQLPGVQDSQEVKSRLDRTAKLTFQLVCEAQPSAAGQNPPPECKALPMKDDPNNILWVQTSSRATVDGADLTDARGAFDQNNSPVVSFRFNQKGAERFGKMTRDNVGKPFAIVLDEMVMSAPRINEPILGGSGQISGSFTVEETNNLAVVLRSGALPARLSIVEERTVGPSLGSDSIKAGVNASIIGLVLVVGFMIMSYGLFGVFANIALLVNLIMLIAVMSFFGFTMTLPGIAAIVLTMGMAVDSNVIIFERMREEWRNGRSAMSAIETGFKSAFGTIFDSNFTALIAAVVLFGVGSGPVRGFAITHAIGILTTVFTAYTVTRYIVSLWVARTKPREVPL
ncbi:protein translocase subunit SecD [Aestuariivirga sp.]|uniref:protein translocase subunit SecD n=1 Tax=Aestuariivirga sp. TaxID=2650926 RepID=UPI0025C2FF43|nr:protein translocase subunit SecD [Aestuariivirga sp.]MCA3555192.1 protein translocase subunit SecD [Aestuariivirga sp.]